MYVRHAYISGLHHYLVIFWDDEVNGWSVGIAALPSKRQARKFAGGYFDTKEQVAGTTNLGSRVRISWFLREIDRAMNSLGHKYGKRDWYAIPVDDRRFRAYRFILGKRGWTESSRILDGELTDLMVSYHR